MSICGNCPYPSEYVPEKGEEERDPCSWGCSFEDAAYRAQWAYDQLMDRYVELEKENELLKAENDIMKHKLRALEDDCK